MQAPQHILDNLNAGVIALDTEMRVAYINPSAEALLDVSAGRCLGSHLSQLILQGEALTEVLTQASESAGSQTRRGLNILLLSGQEITIDLSVTPVDHLEDGLILELQLVDRLLKISRDESLISAQEATRAVIRGLAHEIKNPLGGVRGAAQLLARELPNPDLQEYTNIIIEEADRLRDLVDRLLGPKNQPELAAVNLHEVTEHVCNLVTAEIGDEVQLQRDYDPSLPEALVDKPQLIQALLNIVRNAVQITEGQQLRCITLRTRAQRQFTIGAVRHRLVYRIDVKDNGPGVPDELRHNIFVPMITGRAEGTGLGLSISQAIVNRHQGLLDCQSEPGKTVFSIYLPMEPTHA